MGFYAWNALKERQKYICEIYKVKRNNMLDPMNNCDNHFKKVVA